MRPETRVQRRMRTMWVTLIAEDEGESDGKAEAG